MASISWDASQPSSATSASLIDNNIRSLQSNFAGGVGTSFFWPGSGGGSGASAGETRPGALRFARSTSGRTGGFPDGFLLLDPTRVAVHHIGSTTTGFLGHAAMLDRGSATSVTWPQDRRWIQQSGTTAVTASTGSVVIVFPIVYVAGQVPFVQVEFFDEAGDRTQAMVIDAPRNSQFTSTWSGFIPDSGGTILWRAEAVALI